MSVFISGASSGIGEACARVFAAAGHDLVLVARRTDRLEKMAEELKSRHQISIHFFHLDVRDYQGMQKLVQDHPAVFSSIDTVINNAGMAKGLSLLQEGDPAGWDMMIDTNIKGLLYITRVLLPGLIAQKKGHIVNIGSVAGQWVYERGNVYCATKYAVHSLTEALRIDLAGTGIRVTEISPGMVETEFSKVRLEDPAKAKAVYEGKSPLTATDIAESVLWCCERPAHVNIQELVIYPTAQPSVHAFHRK